MAKEEPIVPVEEIDLNEDYQLPGLLIAIMAQQTNNAHSSWSALAEGYQRSAAVERATTILIRDAISNLCSKPWTPNPESIRDALYPDSREINRLAERILKGKLY